MKLPVFLIFFLFSVSFGWSQSIITFERIFIKVDTMPQNSSRVQKIKFMNTGTKSLVITGCTPEFATDKCTFEKKAVAPGAVSYISYQPDASACGKYSRNVTVTTKEGESVTLHLKGVIWCESSDSKKSNN